VTANEAVLRVVDTLDALSVPYMVVGSYSSNVFGIARSTLDADFVLELGETSISRVADRLGEAFLLDPQASFETITGTCRYEVRARGSLFKIELFLLSEDAHDQERFLRRTAVEALGRTIWMPTAEDVIVTKLRWSQLGKRTKDTDDVRNVIAVRGERLDWDYIHRWCDVHGTRALLDELRASLPTLPAGGSS